MDNYVYYVFLKFEQVGEAIVGGFEIEMGVYFGQENGGIDGFGDVVYCVEGKIMLFVCYVGFGGEENNWNIFSLGISFEFGVNFVVVYFWYYNI